jgi:hypothetical protein
MTSDFLAYKSIVCSSALTVRHCPPRKFGKHAMVKPFSVLRGSQHFKMFTQAETGKVRWNFGRSLWLNEEPKTEV